MKEDDKLKKKKLKGHKGKMKTYEVKMNNCTMSLQNYVLVTHNIPQSETNFLLNLLDKFKIFTRINSYFYHQHTACLNSHESMSKL